MYHNFLIHSSTNGHLTTLSLWSLDRPWTPSISFCTPCFSAPWFLVFRTCLTPCPRAFAHAVEIVAQVCLTFCDSMDPPGSSVHGISRQECWSGLPFPPSGDLPDPGTEPLAPALQADSLPSEPWCTCCYFCLETLYGIWCMVSLPVWCMVSDHFGEM